MTHLRYVTLTGAGEASDVQAMKALSESHPLVEWGVLYSPKEAGRDNRYPTLDWLESFAQTAGRADMSIALHVCGAGVRTMLDAMRTRHIGPEAQRLFALAEQFGRVQLNTVAKQSDEQVFRDLIGKIHRIEARTRVILQYNERNAGMCRQLNREYGFEALVDSSGGRGIVPSNWPLLSQADVRRLGMAGGLGPDNLLQQLDAIAAVTSGRSIWVDMEGKLRDERDELDLERCATVLVLADQWVAAHEALQGRSCGSGTRQVAELDGLWLDWWVGAAQGLNMVVPPANACAATKLDRSSGNFDIFRPTEDLALATRIFSREQIALSPTDKGSWIARTQDVESMEAPQMHIAALRAVVAKHFGAQVAVNPFDSACGAGHLQA